MSDFIPYDRDYDPEDFADFDSVEDRHNLADLALEPCDLCGGELRVRGAFGHRVVVDCLGCSTRSILELGVDEDDEEEDEEDE